ncbi:MAG: response regulator, partial [Bryobacteraceae bacterium]
GTGLGLSTVYGVVKQSGGTVSVYSGPGWGSVFKVFLPRVDEPAVAEAEAPVVVPAKGTETVLLVEDEVTVRKLVLEVLEQRGYNVLEAVHTDDAVRICHTFWGKIDLLVSDVVMPKMNGWELAQRVMPLRPEMKVLFISGFSDSGAPEKTAATLGAAFLFKPFTPEVFARKVRDVLDGKLFEPEERV